MKTASLPARKSIAPFTEIPAGGLLSRRQLELAQVPSPLGRRRNRLLKRAVDVGATTVFILLLFPWFLPLAALLICIDSRGPVFFRQRRHKRNGREFYCLKLRTMVLNRDADTCAAFEGDRRITRVGRLLRRTHLDELPQLLNVWWGDMSLVGPRPHMLSENERFTLDVPGYRLRQQVKPGITGLAQVRGHVGATHDRVAIERRVQSDVQYIRHWTLVLDARILWGTVASFFTGSKNRRA
ncbi:sugar transferase [Flaviaesturariibacter aridisoli]|uniref:Polyprenyl glycosylphosphotransferase n=1 Tax=Flaviaesturariibacter aridisoli TaxID=2545761 RepID=A0A4R4E0E4_9BACT|nr:sugar transferase [Flaviaesturariibacter aridisoli]TCZ70615.1 polyprenyl glycosylphosphotransferase [Flaviaesturariibacter aridisoli]